jgi:hypothetical protein
LNDLPAERHRGKPAGPIPPPGRLIVPAGDFVSQNTMKRARLTKISIFVHDPAAEFSTSYPQCLATVRNRPFPASGGRDKMSGKPRSHFYSLSHLYGV